VIDGFPKREDIENLPPFTTPVVPTPVGQGDEWEEYETVNDPASGKVVPNEGHASME
jgi:hypothetical protein